MEKKLKKIDPFIIWHPSYCKACQTCIQICPVQNLHFKKDEMVSKNKCTQCLLCMKYCPDFAIEVESKKQKEQKDQKS